MAVMLIWECRYVQLLLQIQMKEATEYRKWTSYKVQWQTALTRTRCKTADEAGEEMTADWWATEWDDRKL